MKVKNIAFSGIMAAILMGTAGANAAVEIASKQYVISQTSDKATTTALTEGLATKADKEAFEALQGAVNSTESGLATKASTTALEEGLALKANAADVYTKDDVYTKTEANNLLATKADVEDVYEKTQTYTQDEVKAYVSKTLTDIGEGNISLDGYAKTQDVNNALDLKADKTAVEAITTSLSDYAKTTYVDSQDAATLGSAKSYTDEQVSALTGEGGAITTLAAKVTANEGAIATKADASTVEALSGQISALGDTYATDTEVSGIKTELEGKIDVKVATETYAAKVGVLETAIAGNKTATETNATAIKTINEGAVMTSGISSDKVAEYDAAVAELANKITMPKECSTGYCVLSTLNGTVQWTVITDPVGVDAE